jgi:hypothetical protein
VIVAWPNFGTDGTDADAFGASAKIGGHAPNVRDGLCHV